MSMKRIGSVPYLNSVPLTCGIEEETEYIVPSALAENLRAGELDAAETKREQRVVRWVVRGVVRVHDGHEQSDAVAESAPRAASASVPRKRRFREENVGGKSRRRRDRGRTMTMTVTT